MIAIGCDHGGYELKQRFWLTCGSADWNTGTSAVILPLRWITPSMARRWPMPWHRASAKKASSSVAPCWRHLHRRQQGAQHPLRAVRGLLLCQSHPPAQQRQRACSGRAGHRHRPGAGNRGHLPGHALSRRRSVTAVGYPSWRKNNV